MSAGTVVAPDRSTSPTLALCIVPGFIATFCGICLVAALYCWIRWRRRRRKNAKNEVQDVENKSSSDLDDEDAEICEYQCPAMVRVSETATAPFDMATGDGDGAAGPPPQRDNARRSLSCLSFMASLA